MSFHFTVKLWLFYEKDFFLFVHMNVSSFKTKVRTYSCSIFCNSIFMFQFQERSRLYSSNNTFKPNICFVESFYPSNLTGGKRRTEERSTRWSSDVCVCVATCEWRCSEIMESNAYSIKASSMHWSSSKCYVIFIKLFVFLALAFPFCEFSCE